MIKRLSDFEDEHAIDVLADLLEPATAIISNPEVAKVADKVDDGIKGKMVFAKAMLKHNRDAVLEILAILSDTEANDYHCNAATVIKDLLHLLSDEELLTVFGLRQKKSDAESSGSATENTEGVEE